jgi:transcriptional regulator with XRE-family HTH domain
MVAHVPDDRINFPLQHDGLQDSQERKDRMARSTDIEQVVRTRLRSLRQTLGLSLDDVAAATNLSPSTISRVETGKRTISLDVLLPLATALHVDLDTLLDVRGDDDVVIRPTASTSCRRTTWLLSRPTGRTTAIKMRIEPSVAVEEQQVHPGHDWFFVMEGRVRLRLGEREVLVAAGEAAEFNTMTPHALSADDGPAELVMIFDRDGLQAHTHRDPSAQGPMSLEPG